MKINNEYLFSDETFLSTKRGWKKAKDVKIGDKIIGAEGEITVTNIIKCGKRPEAPIISNL
jgi:hypothetical protein